MNIHEKIEKLNVELDNLLTNNSECSDYFYNHGYMFCENYRDNLVDNIYSMLSNFTYDELDQSDLDEIKESIKNIAQMNISLGFDEILIKRDGLNDFKVVKEDEIIHLISYLKTLI